ncbi:MAG: hypothetical protein V5A44_05240 [Haloarculaceae archaeon]
MAGNEPDLTEPSDDDLRIRLYEVLHERARTERKWQFWRLLVGHGVIGVIVAYAFVFGRWRFIALTPVLYGIVVMDALKYSVRLLHVQRHLVAVERELAEREPLFGWVDEYGFFGSGRRVSLEGVDLNKIPEIAQFALIGAIYLALVAVSLLVWTPPGSAGAGGALRMTRGHLALSYGTFTLLFAVVIYVGYVHYRRVQAAVGSTTGE